MYPLGLLFGLGFADTAPETSDCVVHRPPRVGRTSRLPIYLSNYLRLFPALVPRQAGHASVVTTWLQQVCSDGRLWLGVLEYPNFRKS